MAKRRRIFRVMMRNGRWVVKVNKECDGWTLDDSPQDKGEAIDAAYAHAKRFRPALVRIFTAGGRLQIEAWTTRAGKVVVA